MHYVQFAHTWHWYAHKNPLYRKANIPIFLMISDILPIN